jgi:autotransporter-associated beta strand protein
MGDKIMNRQPSMKKVFFQKLSRLILPTILSLGFFSASVSQGQTLTDIYWNPFNTNGLGGSGSWSTSPTNWSFNSAGSAQSNNIPMPTVGTNVGQSAYYRYNFGGSNGTVSIGTSQSALGAVNITSSGYIFVQSGNFSGGGNVGGVSANATTTLGSGVRVDFNCTTNGSKWTIASNSISGNADGTSSIYLTGTNGGTNIWSFEKTTTFTNLTIFINSQGATNANSAMVVQNGSSSTGGHPSINANIVNNSTNGVPLTLGVTSSGNLTNAGSISGSNAVILRVGGSGNIVLAASNSYTGGSTLTNSSSGSIDLDKVTRGQFGSGDIAVLSSSTFFYIRSLINEVDITNNIRIDGVLKESTTSGWRLTNSGTISGVGSILSTNSGSNLYLTGTNNSFGGGVTIGNGSIFVNSFGRAGANSSIGTNGLITLGGPGATANGISIRTVSTNDETTDKRFLLTGADGLAAQIEANLGSVLTLTADLQSGGSGIHTLQLSGKTNTVVTTVGTNSVTNIYTGKLIFSGLIADASNITNTIKVGGTGTGIVQLANTNNSFGAAVVVTNSTSGQNTTLQVVSVGTPGQASSIGTNGNITIGGVNGSTCYLEYLGNGETSAKSITWGQTNVGGLWLVQSGTGNLKLTGGLLVGSATNASRTLNLAGATTGIGEVASNLGDYGTNVVVTTVTNTNAGVVTTTNTNYFSMLLGVSKSGSGTWILSGTNSYSGPTIVAGSGTYGTNSVLKVAGTKALSTLTSLSGSTSSGNTATLDLSVAGDYVVNSYGTTALEGRSMNFMASSGGTTTLTFTNATNVITTANSSGRTLNNNSTNLTLDFLGALDISSSTANDITLGGVGDFKVRGVIFNSSNATARSLLKKGSGTLRLYATNTYNGTTTINDGKLVMVNAKALPASSPTVLDGGQLKVDYVGADSDTLGNLRLTADSTIDAGTSSASTLNFASATNWLSTGNILKVSNYYPVGAKIYIVNTNGVPLAQIKKQEDTNAVASLTSDGLLTFSVPSSGSTYTGLGYLAGSENVLAANGLSNLMNYALGQNGPSAAFPAGPALSTDSNGMTLSATGRKDDTSLKFYVQWTTDLSGVNDSWDLHSTEVFAPNLTGTILFGEDRKFIRLKVVRP